MCDEMNEKWNEFISVLEEEKWGNQKLYAFKSMSSKALVPLCQDYTLR